MRPVGWKYESARHSLAAKGVKTRYNFLKFGVNASKRQVENEALLRKLREEKARDDVTYQIFNFKPEDLENGSRFVNVRRSPSGSEVVLIDPRVYWRSAENDEPGASHLLWKVKGKTLSDRDFAEYFNHLQRMRAAAKGELGKKHSKAVDELFDLFVEQNLGVGAERRVREFSAKAVRDFERAKADVAKRTDVVALPDLTTRESRRAAWTKGSVDRFNKLNEESVRRGLSEDEKVEMQDLADKLKRRNDFDADFYARKKDFLKGGLGDKRKVSSFDKVWLKKGTRVEMEHTKDPKVAREIAMDHMTEFGPGYYKELAKMEARLKGHGVQWAGRKR